MAKTKPPIEQPSAADSDIEALQSPPLTHRQDPLRSIKETATQLGVDHTTVGRWVQPDRYGRRRLKSVRLPSGIRKVRQSVINQILAATGKNGDATEDMSYEEADQQ